MVATSLCRIVLLGVTLFGFQARGIFVPFLLILSSLVAERSSIAASKNFYSEGQKDKLCHRNSLEN